jgi:N-acetylglucosamine-6-phosphate deacetylase
VTARRFTGRDPATGAGLAATVVAGRIAAIEPATVAADAPYLAPGLVDLQVNGYRGIDLNDGAPSPDKVIALTRLMHAVGVTSYAPTLITASRAALVAALGAIRRACEADAASAAAIAFVHVEGPFLAAEDGPRGAHPAAHIRAPDLAEVAAWQQAAGGRVGVVTLSPHWPGVEAFIAAVVAQGIRVAIGHTGAGAEQVHAAARAGATLSTHLGNGAAATLPRHPNFIWAQLADDRLAAGLIADGFHLPADTLKAMLRAKGLDRAFLVSDTAALGGMPPGVYDQPIGGRVEVGRDGRLSVAGTPYLAGAGRPLVEDVARAIAMADLTLADGLRLATANPGAIAGGGRGGLEPGAAADLIRFRWQAGAETLDLVETVAGGVTVMGQAED